MKGSQDFAADPRNEGVKVYVNGDLVPRDEALSTGLSVEEGIRVILSAGTASPPRLPRQRG